MTSHFMHSSSSLWQRAPNPVDVGSKVPVERRCPSDKSFTAGAPLSGQCVITREIAVAEGVYAPGHLGELTQIVPFDMVDTVLAECAAVALDSEPDEVPGVRGDPVDQIEGGLDTELLQNGHDRVTA
ncbi:hypothetical protein ACFY5H_34270 [Streptomyces sp. NPDC013012]|uniref:hypothetical protein n=1 Tax=Streptomyces sp. NPDC013012 TaxID=3364860 RepID=UPI003685CE4F